MTSGGPLPPELGGEDYENHGRATMDGEKSIREFLQTHIPPSDQKEIDEELRKPLPIQKDKKKELKQPQPRKKAKYLTSRERRDLGLYKLPRKSKDLKYKDMKPLHKLWQGYVSEVLGLDHSREEESPQAINSGHFNAVLDEQLQLRLCRCDFHGALIKVTKSSNPSLLGMQGIVVMETKNAFLLLDKRNIVKNIPKCGCSFTFVVANFYLVTIEGKSICMRPSDRAVKKWKNKPAFNF